MSLDKKVREVALFMSNNRHNHTVETGHTNFSMPELRQLDPTKYIYEFVEFCLDCKVGK